MSYNENDEYELESEGSEDIYLEDTEEFRTTAYQAEEISRTKFNIVICQLYNSKRHGTPDANSGVEYHFITEDRFKLFDIGFIDYFIYGYHNMNLERIDEITPHDIFRNYKNIIQRPDYIKPEINGSVVYEGVGEDFLKTPPNTVTFNYVVKAGAKVVFKKE